MSREIQESGISLQQNSCSAVAVLLLELLGSRKLGEPDDQTDQCKRTEGQRFMHGRRNWPSDLA